MKRNTFLFFLALCAPIAAYSAQCPELLNYSMKKLRSTQSMNFCEAFRGKVILAVNTASNCGFTPQFKGLESLYKKYKDDGLVVLGFPSGDFRQEFDDPEKTAEVCYLNYGVTFPMFTKSAVSGKDANNFFRKLTSGTSVSPEWNFYKYLINREGQSVAAFSNLTKPVELESKIQDLLSINLETVR